jgi:hypothetical protein
MMQGEGKLKSRLLRTAFAAAMAPAAFGAVALAEPAEAQAADAARCQVHVVLASKEGDGTIPKNLSHLSKQLKDDEFAAYKGFHLLEKKSLGLQLDQTGSLKLKPGNRIKLTLLSASEKRLELKLDLTGTNGSSKLLSTTYSTASGAVLMVRAGKHTSGDVTGKLFLALQCAAGG